MTGKEFENSIASELRGEGYKVEKNEEGGMTTRGFVPKKNPFLDFTVAKEGKVMMVETKVVKAKRVPIGKGGITENQLQAAAKWEEHGVPTLFMVGFRDGQDVRVFPGLGLARHMVAGGKGVSLDDEETIAGLTSQRFTVINGRKKD